LPEGYEQRRNFIKLAKIPLCILVLAYPTIKEKIWGPDVVEDKTPTLEGAEVYSELQ
jgi:hypothetical protein